jgi:hypothetical protein
MCSAFSEEAVSVPTLVDPTSVLITSAAVLTLATCSYTWALSVGRLVGGAQVIQQQLPSLKTLAL